MMLDTAGVRLAADVTVPADSTGVVLFAHGSGSSRQSPRNGFVAEELNRRGLATVLLDLLTPDEDREDAANGQLRFDIGLLADRLIGAIDQLTGTTPATESLAEPARRPGESAENAADRPSGRSTATTDATDATDATDQPSGQPTSTTHATHRPSGPSAATTHATDQPSGGSGVDTGGVVGLPIGLFGASTGGAAALVAAAARPDVVRAVVSRGGRPDLAGPALAQVKAPTLLIVGEHDPTVVDLNQRARGVMTAQTELRVVPGASHLFEEPGTLEEVAAQAADWFTGTLPHG